MATKVLVPLAPGAEEMEVVIVVDVLRRAGVEVLLAGLDGPGPVRCSRSVVLVPDAALTADLGPFDAVVLPGGGPGSERLCADATVGELLRRQAARGGLIGAICAGPTALVAHGIGKGRAMTSHPSAKSAVGGHGSYREERVTEDGNLITSRGPGTAFEFALALVARLCGREVADAVAGPMLVR